MHVQEKFFPKLSDIINQENDWKILKDLFVSE